MSMYETMMTQPAACLDCDKAVTRSSVLGEHWCPRCQDAHLVVRRLVTWRAGVDDHQVAALPLDALLALFAARVGLEQLTRQVVRDALDADATWDDIGIRLHLTSELAIARYSPAGYRKG